MRSASLITERPLRISAHPVSIGNDDEHSATNNNDNNKHIYVRHLKTEFFISILKKRLMNSSKLIHLHDLLTVLRKINILRAENRIRKPPASKKRPLSNPKYLINVEAL